MIATPHAPRRVEAAAAFGCWVTAVLVLLALPLLESSAGEPIETAAPSSIAWWLTIATLTVQAVILLWSRIRSRAVVLAVTALPIALAATSPGAIFSLTSLAALVSIFWAVVHNPLRRLRSTLCAAALMITIGGVVNVLAGGGSDPRTILFEAALQAVTVVGLSTLIGTVVAARRDARIAHRSELSALTRERDALVRAAVADERTAMARELHDIAAHHLSGIALMAVVTDRQIDSDPDAAHLSAQQIRSQARSVLDDLRGLVGLLRDDSSSLDRSVETVATVPALVQTHRASGAEIDLRILGVDDSNSTESFSTQLGPLAQLVIYRMVQEALTNASTHAPGTQCIVELDGRDAGSVTVTVSNTGVSNTAGPSTGGFGLVGMGERAHLVGGELRYGPTPEAAWEVVLTLPRGDKIIEQRRDGT